MTTASLRMEATTRMISSNSLSIPLDAFHLYSRKSGPDGYTCGNFFLRHPARMLAAYRRDGLSKGGTLPS